MALADRYQAVLAHPDRSVRGFMIAAGVLEQLTAARERVDPKALSPAEVRARVRSRAHRRDQHTLVAVRAAVGGIAELSLTVRADDRLLDGVRLQHGPTSYDLPSVAAHGELTRLVATVPPAVWNGDPWTVSVLADGVEHRLVTQRGALDVRTDRAADGWPPRAEPGADGGVVVTGRPPAVAGVEYEVEVGPATLHARWASDEHPDLAFIHESDAHESVTGTVDATGRARAEFELRRLAERPGSWRAFASGTEGRRPLRLLRGEYPELSRILDRRKVRVPRRDGVVVPVEVGYATDNQLTVRVGRTGPSTS